MDNTSIECVGEVQGRWRPVDPRKSDSFRPRFEISTFKVVDLEACDLIIGRDTINELELLKPNRTFFGAFRRHPIHVDCTFCAV
jgi:hypothetical protein